MLNLNNADRQALTNVLYEIVLPERCHTLPQPSVAFAVAFAEVAKKARHPSDTDTDTDTDTLDLAFFL